MFWRAKILMQLPPSLCCVTFTCYVTALCSWHSVMATVRIKSCFVCVGRGGHAVRTMRGQSVPALQRTCVQCYRKWHVLGVKKVQLLQENCFYSHTVMHFIPHIPLHAIYYYNCLSQSQPRNRWSTRSYTHTLVLQRTYEDYNHMSEKKQQMECV